MSRPNVMVRISVRDFDFWHEGFWEHSPVRAGFCDEGRTRVFRSPAEPNEVIALLYSVDAERLPTDVLVAEMGPGVLEEGDLVPKYFGHVAKVLGEARRLVHSFDAMPSSSTG